MRAVYHILQKLRDQEKREKHIKLASEEMKRHEQEIALVEMSTRLEDERNKQNEKAGLVVLQEHFNMHRFLHLRMAEVALEEQSELVEDCRDDVRQAQVECRIMEELIDSMHQKEELEKKRKSNKFNDELGSMGWWRKQ